MPTLQILNNPVCDISDRDMEELRNLFMDLANGFESRSDSGVFREVQRLELQDPNDDGERRNRNQRPQAPDRNTRE